MKKLILTFVLAIVAGVAAMAQQISVVSSNGATNIYSTLQEAIEGASANSVIYLPGGGFPIADSVKITKKLTIIGIGHKIKGENADGYTTITGNLFFNEGSDGSAVMGAYITGNVYIANDKKKVDNVLVRYCNLNSVQVQNNTCMGTEVNQNYIRNTSGFSGTRCNFTNNIAHSIDNLDNGYIENNILTSFVYSYYDSDKHAMSSCDNTTIKYNIILDWKGGPHTGSNCQTDMNMAQGSWGSRSVNVTGVDWKNIFVNHAGITPNSDYHFKGDYQKYNSEVGIYAGTGFSDSALPPVPYIVAKQIPEQTDAEGKLNIKIRVRAGE